jgi:sterol desaturase/sphingolipid hydroxylase (fatty acid hydroxylase superfamily)
MLALFELPETTEGWLAAVKAAATVLLLALFWGWETLAPLRERGRGRLRHAGRNLAMALLNTAVLALFLGVATVAVADWAAANGLGLLHALDVPWPLALLVAVVLLDGWMYAWHRANHAVPLLWRFHRMHHSDDQMDVTTATRFHLGEHVIGAALRLGLVPLFGLGVWHLLAYDVLVVAVTQFHHANIDLGRWDRRLRWLLVTPYVHHTHHSRRRPETDSNFSTIFSFWDRLAGTFRHRPETLRYGLDEFDGPEWQTVGGMLRTPLVNVPREDAEPPAPARLPPRLRSPDERTSATSAVTP